MSEFHLRDIPTWCSSLGVPEIYLIGPIRLESGSARICLPTIWGFACAFQKVWRRELEEAAQTWCAHIGEWLLLGIGIAQ
jgi:hypothetical protein